MKVMKQRPALKQAVWILLLLPSCYSEPHIEPEAVITNISANPVTIPADGASKTQITVELPEETTDNNLSVVLTTDLGMFEAERKQTITANAQNVPSSDRNNKIVFSNLLSPLREGTGTVTAKTKNYTRTTQVNFSRAFPDNIRITLDKIYYKPIPTEEVAITVRLSRTVGTPSLATPLTLVVTDSLGVRRGIFRNPVMESDSNGQAVNRFSFVNSNFKGSLKAKATSRSATGQILADSVTFYVIKP